jgi:hypothetical protein
LRVSRHAHAVVALAVQQDYRIAIAALRMKHPGAKHGAVRRGDRDVFHVRTQRLSGLSHRGDFICSERPPRGMERPVCKIDASDSAEDEVEETCEKNVP